jgi:hypothetical protein
VPPVVLGMDLSSSTAIWDGFALKLMIAETRLAEFFSDF